MTLGLLRERIGVPSSESISASWLGFLGCVLVGVATSIAETEAENFVTTFEVRFEFDWLVI